MAGETLTHNRSNMRRAILNTVLPLLTGVLLAFCFPTFHCYPLAWVVIAPLFYFTSRADWRTGALRFFLAGWAFHSVLLQWLMANVFWAGGWAFIGFQLLCLLLAAFWIPLGALWPWLHQRSRWLGGALFLSSAWVVMEWLHANLFTGFGWSALGYSQGPDLMVAQWAAVGGVSAVTFLLVLVNALFALALRERCWWRLAAAALVIVVAHGGGFLLLGFPGEKDPAFRAGVFQSDFPQEMKWDRLYTEDMVIRAAQHSRRLAEFEKVDLFLWPEALVMDHFENPGISQPMERLVRETETHLLTGTVRYDPASRRSFNSSVLLSPEGDVLGTYDKVHLAPFGEYMPFDQFFPFLRQIVPIDVDAGQEQVVLEAGGVHIGPLICFEVLFGPMARQLRRDGATCLAVMTNLAWFGKSNAIAQELEIARFRAIETRLPLIHAANTGISGVFDTRGRFSLVNAWIGYGGRYFKRENETIAPADVIMQRFMGAFPVPPPGRRLLPFGPALFPYLMMTLALLLVIGAIFRAEDRWRAYRASRPKQSNTKDKLSPDTGTPITPDE